MAGEAGYWDLFDALQNALFVENRNVDSMEVIYDCVKNIGLDLSAWNGYFIDNKANEAVEDDLLITKQYEIQSVPCLIINGKYKVSGAQTLEQIESAVNKAKDVVEMEEKEISGASCKLEDKKMSCD